MSDCMQLSRFDFAQHSRSVALIKKSQGIKKPQGITQGIKRQQGIGLVEVMVSVLISLFVMAGVLQLFSTSSQNMVASAGASRIQENMRYVFSRISEDLSQTGNLGCIGSSIASNSFANYPIANKLGQASANGQAFDFTDLINGDDNATGSTSPAGSVTTGTDTFRVRYVNRAARIDADYTTADADDSFSVDASDPDYDALRQFQVVALANCSKAYIFMITNDPTSSGGVITAAGGVVSGTGQHNTEGGFDFANVGDFFVKDESTAPSPLYLYAGTTGAYQYFIGTSASAEGGQVCSDSAKDVCALFRRENGNNRELVQGVHDMQIEYGWTDASGNLRFADANTIDGEEAGDPTADIWGLIDRVNITLSFNSIENAIVEGNDVTELLEKDVTRTFNLANQL